MSADDKLKLQELGSRMRSEWDRRIAHDYRYWMSDGVDDDCAMWETGDRDLSLLFKGLDEKFVSQATALDLGCGVGRLVGAASKRCKQVIGVDVSEQAIAEAQRLLSDKSNVTLHLGNGSDISAVESNSIDLAYTFAALASMPVAVVATYLLELQRVLKPGGHARLQLYLGSPQAAMQEDSIAIRCYDKGRFVAAVQAAGFSVVGVRELVLPFEVSDEEAGLYAKFVDLTKNEQPSLSAAQIAEILMPGGEQSAGSGWGGSETEYLMALARAQQHLDKGELSEAREALEFAVQHFDSPEPQVIELLEELKTGAAPSKREQSPASANTGEWSAEIFERNLRVLAERFPEVHKLASTIAPDAEVSVRRAGSGDGVVYRGDTALDQKDKPRRAGEVWAERCCRPSGERLIVIGFASGYHLASLVEKMGSNVHVVEPDPRVLRAALGIQDYTNLLGQLDSLTITPEQFKEVSESLSADHVETTIIAHPQTHALHRSFVDEIRTIFWSKRSAEGLRPSIAVVGPIYGGSLPIASYVYNAFRRLGHRVQYYDLSDFCPPYKKLPEFVRDKSRRSSLESSFVQMLSEIVLEGLSERPVDIMISLAQAPLSPEALTEMRNRGIITAMWFVEDCRRFATWQQISRYYDYMFLIQKEPFTTYVEAAGAGRAIYLPLACDPHVHKPLNVPEEERARWGSPISFLGAGYHNRQQMFAQLANMPFKIWGTEWPKSHPFDKLVQEGGRRLEPEEYVKIFNSSEINLNLHSSMERDGVDPFGDFVNPRTFELAAAGAFQLADNRTLLPELFSVGSEIATFSDGNELEDKIKYFLQNPAERTAITEAARKRVLEEHTYEHRVKSMLGYIYADRSEYLRSRVSEGPWPKTLAAAEKYPELKERLEKVYQRGEEPKLEQLVADIQLGKGALDEVEQMLMFMFNLKAQIAYVNKLRSETR
ncbi:MAG: glycosyltransferase [Bdellovibrionales bacterium]|nr:glycosyltransferase [Bdellovibrionales bacterium]